MHYARMTGHDYHEGYYFVTINTAPRRNCLSRIAGGKVELLPFGEIVLKAYLQMSLTVIRSMLNRIRFAGNGNATTPTSSASTLRFDIRACPAAFPGRQSATGRFLTRLGSSRLSFIGESPKKSARPRCRAILSWRRAARP